jgi:anti-anti-sigma factor
MTLSTDRFRQSTAPPAGSVRVTPAGYDFTIVRLAGEHDLSTVPALSDACADAVSTDSADVLLDLSEVTFIDVSTINVLMQLQSDLDGASRTLTIHEPAACVSRLLAISGPWPRSGPIG